MRLGRWQQLEADVATALAAQRAYPPDAAEAALRGPDRGFGGDLDLLALARDVVRADAALDAFRDEVAAPDRLERLLRAQRLEFTRVGYDAVALASHDAAAEAVLCVRKDG